MSCIKLVCFAAVILLCAELASLAELAFVFTVAAYNHSDHHYRLASNTPKTIWDCSTEWHSLLTNRHCAVTATMLKEKQLVSIIDGVHSGSARLK